MNRQLKRNFRVLLGKAYTVELLAGYAGSSFRPMLSKVIELAKELAIPLSDIGLSVERRRELEDRHALLVEEAMSGFLGPIMAPANIRDEEYR